MENISNIWPDNKRFTFSFCFDIDSSTIWKLRAEDYENGQSYVRSLSLGEYGTKRGVQIILDILKNFRIKATFFMPAAVMELNPDIAQKIIMEGHEIAHHGFCHEYNYGDTAEKQLELIDKCQKVFKKIIGEPAVGFRPTGPLLDETILELEKNSNNKYLISEKGREQPYYKKIREVETKLVELPARIEFDDYFQLSYNFYPPQPVSLDRIASYETVLKNLQNEVYGAWRYKSSCITAFHPQVIGTPGKSLILEKLILYLLTFKKDVWIAPCKEVASYWKYNHERK